MATVVLGPRPEELEALMERRRRAGADRFDEVWDGVLHMVPAANNALALIQMQLGRLIGPLAEPHGLHVGGPFNLGADEHDFRIPDAGVHRGKPTSTWLPTAAMVIEIVSPDDETWQKLPFYSDHDVDEVLIVDPTDRSVHWLVRAGAGYREVDRSGLIDLGPSELAEQIDWP